MDGIMMVRCDIGCNSKKLYNGMEMHLAESGKPPLPPRTYVKKLDRKKIADAQVCLNCKRKTCDGNAECFRKERKKYDQD